MDSCSECGTSTVEFHYQNKKKCKLCVSKYKARWHQKNKERLRKSRKIACKKYREKRWKELQDMVNSIKAAPCSDCRVSYSPWIMQFDHLDGKAKIDNVASMIHDLKSEAAILNEIAKCELVCANCHADRTHHRKNK